MEELIYQGEFAKKYVAYDILENEVNKKEKITYLRSEMFKFAAFILVFLTFALLQNRVHSRYEIDQALKETLVEHEFPEAPGSTRYISFADIHEAGHLWQWVNKVLIDEIFVEGLVMQGNHTRYEVARYNQVLWGIRFRQLRVRNISGCAVPDRLLLQSFQDACYPEFSVANMAGPTNGFGRIQNASVTGTDGRVRTLLQPQFRWSTSGETKEPEYVGELASYPGSGFVQELPLNLTQARAIIARLADPAFPFLDRHTRALFITFTTYNLNLNLFAHATFLVEFGASGMVVAEHRFEVEQLLPRNKLSPLDLAADFFNVLFCVFILYYYYKFLQEIRYIRRVQVWHVVDFFSNLLFGYHLVNTMQLRVFQVHAVLLRDALRRPAFFSTARLFAQFLLSQDVYAMNILLCCIRVFKYLKLSNGLALVWGTLRRALKDILYYFALLLIMFAGFVLCGYLVFGAQLNEFRTMDRSVSSLLRMILGEIDYTALREANRSFAPFFFGSFIIIFFFILVNVFLAILLDAWQVEAERNSTGNRVDLEVDLLGDLKTQIQRWADQARLAVRRSGWLKRVVAAVWTHLSGKNNKRKGFLPDKEVLERLQEWRRKKKNRSLSYVGFHAVKAALEGDVRNQRFVRNEQVEEIMGLCSLHLLDAQQKEKLEEDMADGVAEEAGEIDELPLASLKRLFMAFQLLKDNQLRGVQNLEDKLKDLRTLQSKTFNKVKFLDKRMDQLVPEFPQ